MIEKKLGNLLLIRRLLNKDSLSDLAIKTGLSKMQINRYERGVLSTSEENLALLFKELDIHLVDDETTNRLDEFFHEFESDLFFNQLDENEMLKILRTLKKDYLNSQYAHIYVLMMYICLLNLENSDYEMYYQILEQLKLNDSYTKQFFYAYKAKRYYLNNDFETAAHLYEEAIAMHYDEDMFAFLNYGYAIMLIMLGKYKLALECCRKAKEIFARKCNFYRMVQIEMCEGNIYLNSKEFDLAYEAYRITLMGMRNLDFDFSSVHAVEYNLALLNVHRNEFDKALKILDELYEDKFNHVDVIGLYCMCYLKMGKVLEAIHWIEMGERLVDKEQPKYYIFKIYKILSKQSYSKETMEQLIKNYERIKNRIATCQKEYFLEKIIEISKERKDYETAIHYMDLKMNL